MIVKDFPVPAVADALCMLLDIEVSPMAANDEVVMRAVRESVGEFDRDLTVDGGEMISMNADRVGKAVAVLRMASLRPAFQGIPALRRALDALDPFHGK
jgi:hypothetical protein